MEPQWNPSVELQAIGRTMRIGQERKVTVTRYVVNQSVEKVSICRALTIYSLMFMLGYETTTET